jgi:hypothetical protein
LHSATTRHQPKLGLRQTFAGKQLIRRSKACLSEYANLRFHSQDYRLSSHPQAQPELCAAPSGSTRRRHPIASQDSSGGPPRREGERQGDPPAPMRPVEPAASKRWSIHNCRKCVVDERFASRRRSEIASSLSRRANSPMTGRSLALLGKHIQRMPNPLKRTGLRPCSAAMDTRRRSHHCCDGNFACARGIEYFSGRRNAAAWSFGKMLASAITAYRGKIPSRRCSATTAGALVARNPAPRPP